MWPQDNAGFANVSLSRSKMAIEGISEGEVEVTPEFGFLIECCRRCFSGRNSGPLICAQRLDWPRVIRLARFHRVQGLAWHAVAASPEEDALGELANDAAAIATVNLRAAAESARLLTDSEQAGVRLLFLKGLALGALAYGSSALKSGIDIDLLVASDALNRAASLLKRRGYRRRVPEADSAGLERWHRVRKESVWLEPISGLNVDLHTRAADSPELIPSIGIDSPTRRVDVGNGIELPTFEPSEMFAYLAVHGASSAWFRLKWISDFAALLTGTPAAEIERLYSRSQELHAGRAPAQALLLADRLFGTLGCCPELKATLLADRSSRRLCSAALAQLAGRTEPIEPTSRFLGTARIHWTQFLLLPGAGFKVSELIRQARSALA